jgi:hypothetical protein
MGLSKEVVADCGRVDRSRFYKVWLHVDGCLSTGRCLSLTDEYVDRKCDSSCNDREECAYVTVYVGLVLPFSRHKRRASLKTLRSPKFMLRLI